MQSSFRLPALRVGIPIPSPRAESGGSFTFENCIFSEVVAYINSCETEDIQIVPISLKPNDAVPWNLNPLKVLSVSELQDQESRQRRMSRYFLSKFINSKILVDNSANNHVVNKLLSTSVDLLWSLSPGLFNYSRPYILTIWDVEHAKNPSFPEVSDRAEWSWGMRQLHYSTVAKKAFLCITGTLTGANELSRLFGIDAPRIVVNPFPCPPPTGVSHPGSEPFPALFGLEALSYLLYPAQFWPHKNHLSILLALRVLAAEGILIKVVFTGSDKGCKNQIFKTAIDLGVSNLIVDAGFVDSDKLAALYRNSLALVFPSFFGPDNLPPLEAMSYGTASLVADIPGAREQYGNAVLYFDPLDPNSIACSVKTLCSNDSVRENLVKRGQALASFLTPKLYLQNFLNAVKSRELLIRCSNMSF